MYFEVIVSFIVLWMSKDVWVIFTYAESVRTWSPVCGVKKKSQVKRVIKLKTNNVRSRIGSIYTWSGQSRTRPWAQHSLCNASITDDVPVFRNLTAVHWKDHPAVDHAYCDCNDDLLCVVPNCAQDNQCSYKVWNDNISPATSSSPFPFCLVANQMSRHEVLWYTYRVNLNCYINTAFRFNHFCPMLKNGPNRIVVPF
jgi:hypothetical protein